jgi:hypothetical protein
MGNCRRCFRRVESTGGCECALYDRYEYGGTTVYVSASYTVNERGELERVERNHGHA